MKRPTWIVLMTCAIWLVSLTTSRAQTFTVLVNFDDSGGDGVYPLTGLVQGLDGNIYGSTGKGGVQGYCEYSIGCGTVFKLTSAGALTMLYSFCANTECADGDYPNTLVLGTDGNLYGTTYTGGSNDNGTVLKITPGWHAHHTSSVQRDGRHNSSGWARSSREREFLRRGLSRRQR